MLRMPIKIAIGLWTIILFVAIMIAAGFAYLERNTLHVLEISTRINQQTIEEIIPAQLVERDKTIDSLRSTIEKNKAICKQLKRKIAKLEELAK